MIEMIDVCVPTFASASDGRCRHKRGYNVLAAVVSSKMKAGCAYTCGEACMNAWAQAGSTDLEIFGLLRTELSLCQNCEKCIFHNEHNLAESNFLQLFAEVLGEVCLPIKFERWAVVHRRDVAIAIFVKRPLCKTLLSLSRRSARPARSLASFMRHTPPSYHCS